MDKSQIKLKQLMFKNLDKVYSASKDASEAYGIKAISIPILKEVIKRGRLNKRTKDVNIREFQGNYNTVLNSLLKVCETAANEIGANQVSYEFFEKCIDEIKDDIIKGMAGNKKI